MRKVDVEDIIGNLFGRLVVIEYFGRSKRKRDILYLCGCSCGNTSIVLRYHLKSGHTKSCGCCGLNFGKLYPKENAIWSAMIQRCTNKKNKGYLNYGGRGITVCAEWRHFKNFIRDMGRKPNNLTLERADNDLGYFKDNCKWATYTEQNRNHRAQKRNISGVVGVSWREDLKKWKAEIRVHDNTFYLGIFVLLEDAITARKKGELKYR